MRLSHKKSLSVHGTEHRRYDQVAMCLRAENCPREALREDLGIRGGSAVLMSTESSPLLVRTRGDPRLVSRLERGKEVGTSGIKRDIGGACNKMAV